jgi:hypothetical protein
LHDGNVGLVVEILSSLFRGRMLGMLGKTHAAGRLEFFGDYQHLADAAAFKGYLGPLWKTDWCVYAKRPFAAGQSRCSPTFSATLIASPSLTAAWSPPVRQALRSNTRITASTARTGTKL